MTRLPLCIIFFFFNDTATTEIYTLSLHDALPISEISAKEPSLARLSDLDLRAKADEFKKRSEEHTSELQSPCNLVCRLLLEKKKKNHHQSHPRICSNIRSAVQLVAVVT